MKFQTRTLREHNLYTMSDNLFNVAQEILVITL